jgi:6-phosphogluconate dehydrogenase
MRSPYLKSPKFGAGAALVSDPELKGFEGRVSDSGEGRWTIKAAVDTGVPTPVLTASLYERFGSRGNAEFQGKLLSALRLGFGGHVEKPAAKGGHSDG